MMMRRWKEKFAIAVAWALPRYVAYWTAVRVAAHASRVHGDLTPTEISVIDAMKAWDVRPETRTETT
jgi:hypothetical protein